MGAFARRVARLFGYDLIRFKASFRFEATLHRLLAHHDFDGVVDVGANTGVFSRDALAGIAGVPVWSFEPTGSLAADLAAQAASEPRWTVVRSAVGDAVGEAVLNISDKSVFNSLNAANPDFERTMSGLTFSRHETVPVSTLDMFARGDKALAACRNLLLKVDTQGHDLKVLRGAKKLLPNVRAVIVELPFQNIYDSADTHLDILSLMDGAGFSVYGTSPITSDAKGAVIEADAFFVRR